MKIIPLLCLLVGAVSFTTPALASSPTVLRLTPAQDVGLTRNDSRMGNETLGVANRGRDFVRRTLLQFDLTPLLEARRPVAQASLRLMPSNVIGEPGGTIAMSLWALPHDTPAWDEHTVVWSTAPQIVTQQPLSWQGVGARGEKAGGLTMLAVAEYDTTTSIKDRVPAVWTGEDFAAWLESARSRPQPLVSFLLASEADHDAPGLFFHSKNFIVSWARAYVPVLEIQLK